MRARRSGARLWPAAAAMTVVLTCTSLPWPTSPLANRIAGPFAALLASTTDLGPAHQKVRLTAALRSGARPDGLYAWARRNDVTVRWDGREWAVIEGAAQTVGAALGIAVHDYRNRAGRVFYASPQQPAVPEPVRGEVTELGRVLGYTPFHDSTPPNPPRDVPGRGLSPATLLRTYNIEPLRQGGFTGKGVTVVVFAFDGFDQADLDTFADTFSLPRFTPELVGPMASERSGEAAMDLEAVHAIAPDARKVLVNARPTVEGDGSYEKVAAMMDDATRRYPGAVWSLSIGWGCDKLFTAADLAPVRGSLAAAHKTGTTAFDASGDLAGLECKGGDTWATPPGPDEIGLDAVASVPEMTDVGGTSLSTDEAGNWLSEQAWFDVPLSQGTGGGVSELFERPEWQELIDAPEGPGRRLTPDISAVSDPNTGLSFVYGGHVIAGGGTSLATPLLAGMAAVMNQYLVERGGQLLGDLNPLLYEVAQGAALPGFRDIPLGANAVNLGRSGYDLVTGLGTLNVANLTENLLTVQKSRARKR